MNSDFHDSPVKITQIVEEETSYLVPNVCLTVIVVAFIAFCAYVATLVLAR